MLFPTLIFGLFFLALFALVWSVRDNEWRKIVLLVGSWVFYGAWDGRFVALLIASSFGNWLLARGIAAARGRAVKGMLLALGVALNLGVLGFFKYYHFFVSQAATWLAATGWLRDVPLLEIILPVGVSFFTFQGISYVIDVARGKCAPARLLDVTLLMSFFPHLVAGPIVRAVELIPQFQRIPRLTREAASQGLFLIAWGLFKKVVIASQLATELVDPVFFDPSAHNAVDLLAGVYGYAVQIYCDFSAYSDMAIGLAALLGYRFPENFDQPYRASSLQEFWRRWHISLSSWLRDYLYITLGGSRGSAGRTYLNLFITMLLGGLWHGASWNFIIWGALHGAWLCIERVLKTIPSVARFTPPRWLGIVITFHIVCLGWIFFRAESFSSALTLIGGLFKGGWRPEVLTPFAAVLIVLGMALHAVPRRALQLGSRWCARVPAPVYGLALALFILVTDAQRPDGVAPFIYYQF